ncbi:flagellar filament capping protein FliD [Sphingomonas sp. NCPPB 2930]
MAISSVGIGSGIDVKTIVSQLVALEKRPLTTLQTQEASIQSQVSTFSQLKSLTSTFADAASALTRDSGWNSMTVGSTDAASANASVTGIAGAGSYSFEVSKLAQAQTSVSNTAVATGTAFGSGTLTIKVGTNLAVDVTLADGDDTSLAGIASKINDKNAGVVATVITDSSGQRLMLRGSTTGADRSFTATVSSGFAMAPAGALNFTATQAAQNTEATLNGLAISSATREFSEVIPGLKFTASKVTTGPVGLTVTADTATTKKGIQAFVDAYNAINDLLSSSTKYDADTKTAGLLQGDSTALNLQSILRTMVGAATKGGAYETLSDIGVAVQRGGRLTVDSTKLDKALAADAAGVKNLFANATGSDADKGIAVKFKTLTSAMLSLDGSFNAKTDALAAADKRNQSEQDRVNARAAALEKRLNAQYTALDTQMASLTSLNSYISQQVTNWNKSS